MVTNVNLLRLSPWRYNCAASYCCNSISLKTRLFDVSQAYGLFDSVKIGLVIGSDRFYIIISSIVIERFRNALSRYLKPLEYRSLKIYLVGTLQNIYIWDHLQDSRDKRRSERGRRVVAGKSRYTKRTFDVDTVQWVYNGCDLVVIECFMLRQLARFEKQRF